MPDEHLISFFEIFADLTSKPFGMQENVTTHFCVVPVEAIAHDIHGVFIQLFDFPAVFDFQFQVIPTVLSDCPDGFFQI